MTQDAETRRLAVRELVSELRAGRSTDAAIAQVRRAYPAMWPKGIDAEALGMMKDYANMRPNR